MKTETEQIPGPVLPCTLGKGPEGYQLFDAEGKMWCDGMGSREAVPILLAINSQPALLDALSDLQAGVCGGMNPNWMGPAMEKARQALALAKGDRIGGQNG